MSPDLLHLLVRRSAGSILCVHIPFTSIATPSTACQHSLMATLREDQLFEAPSEHGSAVTATTPERAAGLGLARARQPASPAISLDSYQSAPHPGGASWQSAAAAAAASPLLGQEAQGVPAWWGVESPRRAATEGTAAWGLGAAGASGWSPAADAQASPGPYLGDMLTSPGGRLETASLTPRFGGAAGAGAGAAWAPPADSLASGSPSGSSGSGPFAVGRPGIE